MLKAAVEALVELQKVDQALLALTQSKGDLPQKVEDLRRQVAALEQERDQRQAKVEQQREQKAEIVNDLSLLREQLKKYQKQLYQVKNNKEYDAITLEIEETESKADDLELNGLELDDQIESAHETIKGLEENIERVQASLKEQEQKLDALTIKTRKQEEELNQNREHILRRLTPQLINRYERIRQGRNGVAIAVLENGACSACSSKIPPQHRVEIRAMNQIYVCETCGRIIVYDPSLEQTKADAESS